MHRIVTLLIGIAFLASTNPQLATAADFKPAVMDGQPASGSASWEDIAFRSDFGSRSTSRS
jgi:hypothetical protein